MLTSVLTSRRHQSPHEEATPLHFTVLGLTRLRIVPGSTATETEGLLAVFSMPTEPFQHPAD